MKTNLIIFVTKTLMLNCIIYILLIYEIQRNDKKKNLPKR